MIDEIDGHSTQNEHRFVSHFYGAGSDLPVAVPESVSVPESVPESGSVSAGVMNALVMVEFVGTDSLGNVSFFSFPNVLVCSNELLAPFDEGVQESVFALLHKLADLFDEWNSR